MIQDVFDLFQAIFWSITYLLIIWYGCQNKDSNIQMPFLAGSLNIAWEIAAVIFSAGYLGHILWMLLDIVIFIQNIRKIKKLKFICLYVGITLFWVVLFHIFFRLPKMNGMLISSFFIDFIMAVTYVVAEKRISMMGKVPIATTKMIGDIFAWLFYLRQSVFVAMIGFLIFIVNLFYLSLSMEQIHKNRTGK